MMSKIKIAKTAPDALNILWKEGIFKKKVKFGEVKTELENRGYNFTDQTLSMALKDVSFLTRGGAKGDYTYVQKYPYVQEEEDAAS